MRFRQSIPVRTGPVVAVAALVAVAATLLIPNSTASGTVTRPPEHSPAEDHSAFAGPTPAAPFVALMRNDTHGNLRPIGKSGYVASSNDADDILRHVATPGRRIRDGVQIFDAHARLLTISSGGVAFVQEVGANEAEVAQAVTATLKSAGKNLVAMGCTPEQVASLFLPAGVDVAQAVATARHLGADPNGTGGVHPPAHPSPNPKPTFPGYSGPGAIPTQSASSDTPLEECLLRLGDPSHADGWLHNLWHRISGTS